MLMSTRPTISSIELNLIDYIVRDILKDPRRRLKVGEPLITSGLIDSFHLVDLALYVEDAFQVRIEDTELAASVFDTIEELAAIIAHRI